jgi:hypothetical protein
MGALCERAQAKSGVFFLACGANRLRGKRSFLQANVKIVFYIEK